MNKMRHIRTGVALAVLVAIIACSAANIAPGTLCVLCPIGFAEIAAASKSVPWGLLPSVIIAVGVALVLPRAFCSWVCPTNLTRSLFGGRTPRGILGRAGVLARPNACGNAATQEGNTCGKGAQGTSMPATSSLRAQGIVVAVLLVVSLAVGFPVFCLICPIGLAMATLFAIGRTCITWQPEWGLIVFPAMLLIEALLLKRWCSAICPLGFLFGLAATVRAKLGFGPRPRAHAASCRTREGCSACATACPENINLPHADAHSMQQCTLCLECFTHCPTKSVHLSISDKAALSEGDPASRNDR